MHPWWATVTSQKIWKHWTHSKIFQGPKKSLTPCRHPANQYTYSVPQSGWFCQQTEVDEKKMDQERDQGSKRQWRQCIIRLFTCLSPVKRFMSDLSLVSIRIWHETMLWSSLPRDSETTRIGMDGNWAVFKFLYIIHIHICLVDGKSHVMSQTNQKKQLGTITQSNNQTTRTRVLFSKSLNMILGCLLNSKFRMPMLNHIQLPLQVLILHCVGDLPPMAWEPHKNHWAEQ